MTTALARFDLTSRLRSHLFTGQRLKVIKERSERQQIKETIAERSEGSSNSHIANTIKSSPSQEKKFRHMFKRLLGAEHLERSKPFKVIKTEELRTSDPSTPGILKVEARFCHDLHRCVKGTLIATIETIVFLPLSDCEQTTAPRQAAIEMRYEHVRSVAAYYDASVFVFTKRPRLSRQCVYVSPSEGTKHPMLSTAASSLNTVASDEVGQPLEPVLLENELFLCCTVQRKLLVPGSSISPIPSITGAQWFIVPRRSIKVLEKFLVDSNLGFASVTPMDNLSREVTEGNYEKESEKSLNIPDAIGSLISRRMTLNFRSPELSITSSQSYVSRSLGRLMQRTVSAQSKIHSLTATIGGSIGERRRHLSVGCSEELFSDHAAIYANPDTEHIDEECGSIIFGRSSPSTPSFADEKEVFDMLRQSSLAWELVREQELLQRCILAETEKERVGGCETTEPADVMVISPPASLLRSCVLTSPTKIHELFEAIPVGAQLLDWALTFSSELHGFSLRTLYRRCEDFISGDLRANGNSDPCATHGGADSTDAPSTHRTLSSVQQNRPCVLLIKDTTDCLMGAYLSCHPRISRSVFYGTGESFVFHWSPSATSLRGEEVTVEESTGSSLKLGNPCFKKYPWSGKNSFFVSGEPEVLLIGCSNTRSALRIDANLNRGRSQTCETFDNPELTPNGDFFIHTIELWSLS